MFVATVHLEYRVTPGDPSMRFACVSDRDEYRELLHDQAIPAIWYFPKLGHLDASSTEAFRLVHFSVHGQVRTPRRSARKGSQHYTVSLDKEFRAGQEVTISFTYQVLVRQAGHLLFVEARIVRTPATAPTPSIDIGFDGWVFPRAGVAFAWALEGEEELSG